MIIILWVSNTYCHAQSLATVKYDFSSVDKKLAGWVDSGYYKGLSVWIAKDNQVVYQKYFGNYHSETVAYIASAGKWLAAATIAAMVDDGMLHWGDQVNKWLPAFKGPAGNATLKQLLSHTSGFIPYQPEGRHPDDYQSLKQAVDSIAVLPADKLPGTKFNYGGLAMQVAGRMAELATGKTWENIFQEKIAVPLQMRLTHFTPVDSTPGHNPMLAGGARTSLSDYAHFLEMISNDGVFKGRRILSAQAIKDMQADQVGNAMVKMPEFPQKVRSAPDTFTGIYGLGEWREEVDSAGNATLISSPSWAGAYPWIDKINHIYGFMLARIGNAKNGFNAFYNSPVLPLLIRDVLKDAAHPEVKRGYITTTDGARLFYEELGKGEPLIFIHGHSFDHYEWEPQFYAFAKYYRVIRYDVRGYGRSSMPVEFSNCSHAEDLGQLMDVLKIKKAHVVGLSMGGYIATDFLILHPERLLTATMASGDIFEWSPGPPVPFTTDMINKRQAEIAAYQAKGVFENKLEWFNALTIRKGKVIEKLRKPVWEMIYRWDAWQPQHVEPRYLLGTSALDMLQKKHITVPVLVLTGAEDAGQPNKLLKLVSSAKQVFVPHAGHLSNLENAEGFNKALKIFLQAH